VIGVGGEKENKSDIGNDNLEYYLE